MKNYYLTFAFTLLCLSCSDNSQQARVEKLKNINEHLITEIEHLNLLSDSLKKEYNNLEDLLDSTKNKLLQYEKDRNYLEFAKLGGYQSYDSKEVTKPMGLIIALKFMVQKSIDTSISLKLNILERWEDGKYLEMR